MTVHSPKNKWKYIPIPKEDYFEDFGFPKSLKQICQWMGKKKNKIKIELKHVLINIV